MLQNTLVLLCILLRTEKWQMLYRQSVWLYAFYKSYISRLRYRYWSGKSSSVIQMGLKLAVEILEDSGYMNTAVPVATFESQIEIVSKSVEA
jgi:hypothetical protein